jgi:hypothetical protein
MRDFNNNNNNKLLFFLHKVFGLIMLKKCWIKGWKAGGSACLVKQWYGRHGRNSCNAGHAKLMQRCALALKKLFYCDQKVKSKGGGNAFQN